MNHVRRLRLFETSRNTFHSVLLLVSWSVENHATRKQLTAQEKEGAYIQVRTSSWDVERRRERYKTIDLIAEYNHFTWECNHMPTFPPSSLETKREIKLVNVRVRVISIFILLTIYAPSLSWAVNCLRVA